MTEEQPQEQKPAEGSFTEEFRQLGQNISQALQALWDSPERKRLQQDIAEGLNELSSTLKSEANRLSESQTGQRLKSEAQEIRQRVQSGEVSAKVREELLAALRTVNSELGKAVDRMASSQSGETSQAAQTTEPGSGESYGENIQARAGGATGGETGHDEIHTDDAESKRVEGETGYHEVHPDDVDAPPPPSS